MSELITHVDKNDKVLGLKPREEFYGGKLIHRSSCLILLNLRNEILLQKRAAGKVWYPRLYTFSVNGTVSDETYEECIAREMIEEIGILIPFKKLFKYKHFDGFDKTFMTVFVARSDKQITIDKNEAESFVWISAKKLEKDILINEKKYTPTFVKGIKIYLKKYKNTD